MQHSQMKGLNIVDVADLPGQAAKDFVGLVTRAIVDPGYVVIRGLNFGPKDRASASSFLLDFAQHLGTPISHDENGSIVWNIRAKEGLSQTVPTFSEHADEAFLHTDSQYREAPEDIFALLCLSKATCGGGLSLLMTYDDLMAELAAHPDGAAHEAALREVSFPFAVPSAFKTNPDGPEEFVYSPILEAGKQIRFRADTIEVSLRRNDNALPERGLRAFEALKAILSTSSKVNSFYLEEGDLFVLNNRNTLHGRTAFNDAKRHLLRVRLKI